MGTIIPDPRHTTVGPGASVVVDRGFDATSTDPSVRALFGTFASNLEADGVAGLALDTPDGLPLGVRLGALEGDGIPPTIGLSPSGGALDDERYRLTISAGGVTIEAPAPAGGFRALTTLRQLVVGSALRGGRVALDETAIVDRPRFGWRGLTLDVARCFFGVDEVKRVIDMLALYKLNVLHLHLTDDQGWRIEVPAWPLLTEIGGTGALGDHPGGFYTLADFAELVRYAAERFVSIVPEIDLPGHTGAAVKAYPELAGGTGAVGDASGPAGTMDPDAPGVDRFVRDVLAGVAPASPCPYLHLGGDEAFGVEPDAYTRFLTMARAVTRELGKVPVTWQEGASSSSGDGDVLQYWMAFDPAVEAMILSGGAGLPEGMTIPDGMLAHLAETLRSGRAELAAAHGRGARILLSPVSNAYLDRPYAEAPVDPEQQEHRKRLGLKVYPRASVEDSYSWDPASALPEVGDAVVGIECAMWTETVATDLELEFMLLPRLAGVADHAWASGPHREWDEFAGRLASHRRLWEWRSWNSFSSERIPWA
jgi:hexosaminidase